MSVSDDLYVQRAATNAFGSHTEKLELDFQTHTGRIVTLRGEADVHGEMECVFVSAGDQCEEAGLSLFDVAGVLKSAVLDRRIGSDRLRAAIELDWDVRSIAGGRDGARGARLKAHR